MAGQPVSQAVLGDGAFMYDPAGGFGENRARQTFLSTGSHCLPYPRRQDGALGTFFREEGSFSEHVYAAHAHAGEAAVRP